MKENKNRIHNQRNPHRKQVLSERERGERGKKRIVHRQNQQSYQDLRESIFQHPWRVEKLKEGKM